MISVDVRTRTANDVRDVDPAAFFADELPALLADRTPLASAGARELGVRPFALDVDGRAWTVAFDGDRFTVVAGDGDAATIVRLDTEGFDDLVNDLRTPVAFFTAGELDMPRGRLEDFLDWWVVLRSLLDGRRVHTAGAVTFVERDGRSLDLGQAFRIDDDPGDIGHFLGEAGFVHLTGV